MARETVLDGRGSQTEIRPTIEPFASVSATVRLFRDRIIKGKIGRKVTPVTLALCLLASPAFAQTLKLPVFLLVTAGTVDIRSTLHNATQQARYTPGSGVENNPLIAWMEPRMGTAGMLTVGAAVELGAFWLACKRWCETHPKLMKWGLLTGAAAHGMAAAGNILSARDAAAWRRQQGVQ